MYLRHLVMPKSSELCSHPFSTCVPLPQALPVSSFLIASGSLVPAHVLLGISTNLFITLQSDIMHASCKVYCTVI